MDNMSKPVIGMIGVGKMGAPMTRHLLRNGYQVYVSDLNRDNVYPLLEEGAKEASTPYEMAKATDIQFIMVGFDPEVREIVFGENGLLSAKSEGSTIVISSTAKPQTVVEIGQKASELGIHVLDAPVCRGGKAAIDGTLLTVVGGAEQVYESTKPVFESFSGDVVHVGELGHGQVTKTVNNLLLWASAVATNEGFSLAKQHGMDLSILRNAIEMSSGQNWALDHWENMTFSWALKDMAIVMEMSDDENLHLPLCGLIKERVKEVKQNKIAIPEKQLGKPSLT
jgi:3-hydroxyisobutyrate dehydrogenase